MKLGLENMKNLLEILGNPQDSLRFIHIGGTNGKGSISSFFHSILSTEGYKVGLFTSPYLEEFTERIQINGKPIKKEELSTLTNRVKSGIDTLVARGFQHPTEFEIVTALGLLYFYEQKVDIVILEVGLGGRLDATNIIPKSELSIISSIGLDHTMYLGNTFEEIAREKGGIIKEGGDVILYPQSHIIVRTIGEIVKNKGGNLHLIKEGDIIIQESNIKGQSFSYYSENLPLEKVEIKLLGRHQVYNASTVIKGIEVLKNKGFKISKESILTGLKEAYWPGRFEVISNSPLIILDGAHNPQGAEAFNQAIKEYFPGKKIILFIGLLRDKDILGILKHLLPIAKEVIGLRPDNPRAIEGEDLIKEIRNIDISIRASSIISTDQVLNKIKDIKSDEIIAFTGSLYLVGEVKRKWKA